jgi:hypothetical protein
LDPRGTAPPSSQTPTPILSPTLTPALPLRYRVTVASSARQTREVAGVLERTCQRIAKWLRRRGLLQADGEDAADADDGLAQLAASAASGQVPPAGPSGEGARCR